MILDIGGLDQISVNFTTTNMKRLAADTTVTGENEKFEIHK